MAWKRSTGLACAVGLWVVVGAACGSDDSGTSSGAGPAGGGGGGIATGGASSTGGTATGGTSSAGSATGGSSGSGVGGSGGGGGCVPASGAMQTEAVSLQSSDGKTIAGQLRTPELGSCLPGLLLLHQFSNSKAQWEPYVDQLASAGYITLAIDIRGHGDSDPANGGSTALLSDPDQAPLDARAGLDALAGHARVDNSRLAAVGTSIGANLAVVIGTQDPRVKAVVPVSARLSAIESLLGQQTTAASNVFCWAGELDSSGAQADTCTALDGLATGTSQVKILPGSSAHGTLILSQAGTIDAIVTWLDTVL